MSFSTNIKKIRLDALMSQQDFAKTLGVSYSTVNRWENDKGLPTFKAMNFSPRSGGYRGNSPSVDTGEPFSPRSGGYRKKYTPTCYTIAFSPRSGGYRFSNILIHDVFSFSPRSGGYRKIVDDVINLVTFSPRSGGYRTSITGISSLILRSCPKRGKLLYLLFQS